MRLILITLLLLGAASCGNSPQQNGAYELEIEQALASLGLDIERISVPKVPYPVSTPARLSRVDSAMSYPLGMIALGSALKDSDGQKTRSELIAEIVNSLGIGNTAPSPGRHGDYNPDSVWSAIISVSPEPERVSEIPPEWRGDAPVFKAIRTIIPGITDARRSWEKSGGQATASELEAVRPHVLGSFKSSDTPDSYRLIPPAFHQIPVLLL